MRVLLLSWGYTELLTKLREEVFGPNFDELKGVCITTAANAYPAGKRGWQDEEIGMFRSAGLDFDLFDIEGKTGQEIQEFLSDKDFIFIAGGSVYYLLQQLQRTGGLEVIKNLMTQDVLFVGSSAGAVIACPDIAYIAEMDDQRELKLIDTKAFGFTDLFVVPHANQETYRPVAKHIAQNHDFSTLALEDTQALFIEDNFMKFYSI